jgi:hypothetical protein
MATSLTLSVLEISFFLFGAIALGITIHLFIANRRDRKTKTDESGLNSLPDDECALKYLNEIGMRDNEISVLQEQILKSKENVKIFSAELDELHRQNNRFELAKEQLEKKIMDMDKKNNLHRVVTLQKMGIAAGG